MNFTKKLYKAQSIIFGIMMVAFYLLGIISIISGFIALAKTNNENGAEGIGNAFLFVFSLIGAIAGVVLGVVMMIKFIASLKSYKAIKVSGNEFIERKASRIVDLVFGILIVLAGIVSVILNEEILLIIVSIIIAVIILIFLVLDKIAISKVRKELNTETEAK